jgi:Glucosamine 6-phosphate synthetase, contains amidotransferase and phosphosugar isomerase domains
MALNRGWNALWCIGLQETVIIKNYFKYAGSNSSRSKSFIYTTESKDEIVSENIGKTMEVENTNDDLLPFLLTIPLQKLAYYSALKKGYDIDKPRNLAKSVTVE